MTVKELNSLLNSVTEQMNLHLPEKTFLVLLHPSSQIFNLLILKIETSISYVYIFLKSELKTSQKN